MLLRTRIIVFVLLVFSAIASLVFAVGVLREREMDERIAELRLSQLEQAWSFAVTTVADGVATKLENIVAENPVIVEYVGRADRLALASAAHLFEQFLQSEAYSASGELLWSSGEVLNTQALVGVGRLVDMLGDGRKLGGPRALSGGGLGVLAAMRLGISQGDGGRVRAVGALTASIPLREALHAFEHASGARVYAYDVGGRLLFGNDDDTWRAAQGSVAAGSRGRNVLSHDARYDEAVILPVADMMGGRLLTLLVVRDVTDLVANRALWDKATLIVVAATFMFAMLLLYLFLRRSFETLTDAVQALSDLSHGAHGGYVELPRGTDEIGCIAEAVEAFGTAVQQVQWAGLQRERRQRRQQRYIRRQMEQLSATLEEEARRDLLAELKQIETSAADAMSAQSKGVGDELGLIALGFSRLATKVGTQQVQLSQLVRELREALDDKRKLISLQQELQIAANMQLSILPRQFPELSMLDIAAYMQPAKEVGGDFYDVFEVRDGVLGVVVADVSGKGIPAAFFMLISRTMLRAVAATENGPAKTLYRLNNQLSVENEQTMFVTMFYAEIALATGVVTYCNGGHNPPLVVRSKGAVEMVEPTHGMVLAVIPDVPFQEKTLVLEEGDTLLLYTDGVTEAFSSSGDLFGTDRLKQVMAEKPGADARATLDSLMAAVGEFTAGAEQSDDITGVAARWRAQ